jgi:hypothetical protein
MFAGGKDSLVVWQMRHAAMSKNVSINAGEGGELDAPSAVELVYVCDGKSFSAMDIILNLSSLLFNF